MKQITVILLLVFSGSFIASAQDEYEDIPIEIFIIDSYATPESPHTFVLSFFTSVPAKSKLILDKVYEYNIATIYSERHTFGLPIENKKFSGKVVPFQIIVEDSVGNIVQSEEYDFELPYEPQLREDSNFLMLCLFGGVVFGLPMPGGVFHKDNSYFQLTKEIPLISLRGKSYNYPKGYFAIEYSYIFNAENRKFFRTGYKHIFEVPLIKYISPGLNFFTNFFGYNGISPELSIGWFKILDTFTIFTRYRYNFQPNDSGRNFQEVSLGFYSNYFSFYL
jgi:hypothetical protein